MRRRSWDKRRNERRRNRTAVGSMARELHSWGEQWKSFAAKRTAEAKQRKEGTQMTRDNLPAVVLGKRTIYSGKYGRRRSHREQKARATWRWTCYALALMMAAYTVAALAVLLTGKEEMILVAIISGMTAWTAVKVSPEAPWWWYRFNA